MWNVKTLNVKNQNVKQLCQPVWRQRIVGALLLGMALVYASAPSRALPDARARQAAVEEVRSAMAAYRNGDYRRATEHAIRATDTDQTYLPGHLWLGASHAALRKRALAQISYENVIILDSNSTEARSAKAWLRKFGSSRPVKGKGDSSPTQLLTRTLLFRKPVGGSWGEEKRVAINGVIYDEAGTMNACYSMGDFFSGKIILRNPGFDRLVVWVGKRDSSGLGVNQFTVVGNGTVLKTSPLLTSNDPAYKIDISIKGYKAITLIAKGDAESRRYNSAIWGDPLFTKRY